MKATELRVGNYIQGSIIVQNGNIVENNHIIVDVNIIASALENEVSAISRIIGIPLTKEWLLKFGWYRESESISLPESEGLIISENNCTTVRLMDTAGNYLSKSFSFVHELQNLYYGLTGEELEVINNSHDVRFMKGKSEFTEKEADEIKMALVECRKVGREAQKDIRENELRRKLKFYITDFTAKKGFTAEDFDKLVSSGDITIID